MRDLKELGLRKPEGPWGDGRCTTSDLNNKRHREHALLAAQGDQAASRILNDDVASKPIWAAIRNLMANWERLARQ
jgi:hypothetical protein